MPDQSSDPDRPDQEFLDVGGVRTPVSFQMGEREVSGDEWNLAHATSGTTLRAACEGEGLPVSGTNAAKARRLVEAGLTKDQVEAKYGWRARRG